MQLYQTHQKEDRKYSSKTLLPKAAHAVQFRNHNKTGFYSNFLPGYHIVKNIDDSNYVNKTQLMPELVRFT